MRNRGKYDFRHIISRESIARQHPAYLSRGSRPRKRELQEIMAYSMSLPLEWKGMDEYDWWGDDDDDDDWVPGSDGSGSGDDDSGDSSNSNGYGGGGGDPPPGGSGCSKRSDSEYGLLEVGGDSLWDKSNGSDSGYGSLADNSNVSDSGYGSLEDNSNASDSEYGLLEVGGDSLWDKSNGSDSGYGSLEDNSNASDSGGDFPEHYPTEPPTRTLVLDIRNRTLPVPRTFVYSWLNMNNKLGGCDPLGDDSITREMEIKIRTLTFPVPRKFVFSWVNMNDEDEGCGSSDFHEPYGIVSAANRQGIGSGAEEETTTTSGEITRAVTPPLSAYFPAFVSQIEELFRFNERGLEVKSVRMRYSRDYDFVVQTDRYNVSEENWEKVKTFIERECEGTFTWLICSRRKRGKRAQSDPEEGLDTDTVDADNESRERGEETDPGLGEAGPSGENGRRSDNSGV
ncbi:hypothetical protein FQN54_008315 [Arachnomyces sp. PD_36]|nr:hypothetical protein FQN54_008315 [Arachnomyces sp. PD_36]